MARGEYEKAESLFKRLYEKRKTSFNYLESLVEVLQEQEKFEEADSYLKDFEQRRKDYPSLYIELGRNYEMMGETEKSKTNYEEAIRLVKENTVFTSQVGRKFRSYNLLDYAVETYQIALEEDPKTSYIIPLAQIYGEQQKLEKMFSAYIDLLLEEEKYRYAVNKNFSDYVTSDPENEANAILRRLLLKRLQENPEILYNEMLGWLYIQENQFEKAFVQEKAIYRRLDDKNLNGFLQLSRIAEEKAAYSQAEEILDFAVSNAHTSDQKIIVFNALMKVKVLDAKPKNYGKVNKEFEKIFEEYGYGSNTLEIQLQYARFLAFKLEKSDQAKDMLQDLLKEPINTFEEARVKMQLADILTGEEYFNQALIYYSQIKSLVKGTPLAQEALFKVAQTSYYKGDFDWAQTQLKILKQSTSELTANDAMALNLLIEDNMSSDSTQTALKLFAKADLLILQEKDQEALNILSDILEKHEGEKIEDEALLRSAKLYEKLGQYQQAEAAYLKIIKDFGRDILADDAYYFLAELYRTKLDDPEKAMENYRKIIFEHPDSIFFTDARKQFRILRGDDIL